jgi:hypothetical protein
MAGLVVPSVTVCAVALIVAWRFFHIPAEIERTMVFPMAVNPFAWGIWNALWTALPPSRRLPIGWHGAVLPVLLVPAGVVLAGQLQFSFVTPIGAVVVLPPTMVAYYLLWTYVVRSLNVVMGLSE